MGEVENSSNNDENDESIASIITISGIHDEDEFVKSATSVVENIVSQE